MDQDLDAIMRKSIKILVTEPEYFTSESLRAMRRLGQVTAKRMTGAKLRLAVKDVDILVVRIETLVDKRLIRAAKRLRCVVSSTTGLNHIDTHELQIRNIPYFSLHGTHSVSTAEHAIALLFSTARNIPAAHINLLKDDWSRWKYIGTELTHKTLGIFGLGRVGTEVAKRAFGLGMHVIAYDPYVTSGEMARKGVEKVDWKTFLRKSDCITLHSPLTEETEGIFDKKAFDSLKPSSILINTARGAIIDEKALLLALQNGSIRAAAIDVYRKEPMTARSPLKRYAEKNPNLVLTPHLGASTREAVANASDFAVDTIRSFLRKD
jgi:D-3-phosphoglycerate dehydrogenase